MNKIIFIFLKKYLFAAVNRFVVAKLSFSVVKCKDCKYWDLSGSEWDGHRPCGNRNGDIFVDGGDGTDDLYTTSKFGCTDGRRK